GFLLVDAFSPGVNHTVRYVLVLCPKRQQAPAEPSQGPLAVLICARDRHAVGRGHVIIGSVLLNALHRGIKMLFQILFFFEQRVSSAHTKRLLGSSLTDQQYTKIFPDPGDTSQPAARKAGRSKL